MAENNDEIKGGAFSHTAESDDWLNARRKMLLEKKTKDIFFRSQIEIMKDEILVPVDLEEGEE